MADIKAKDKDNILNPHFIQAKWNVTGMFIMDKFLISFIEKIQTSLNVYPIAYVHGCPLSFKWNGGRVNFKFVPSQAEVDWIMHEYARIKLPCYLTFTNRFISPKDLEDYDCNYLLEWKIAGLIPYKNNSLPGSGIIHLHRKS